MVALNTVIAGIFSLGVAILAVWANIKLHNERREFQLRLLQPKLEAYRALWHLMRRASPSDRVPLTVEECKELDTRLTDWYYEKGNGIFLSVSARDLLLEAKQVLSQFDGSSEKTLADIKAKLSKLRQVLKNDLGVYGKEDLKKLPRL